MYIPLTYLIEALSLSWKLLSTKGLVKDVTLKFPSNLKLLSIDDPGFTDINVNALELPPTLTYLDFHQVPFNEGYLLLNDALKYVNIKTAKLAFDNSFGIPSKFQKLLLQTENLSFKTLCQMILNN